MALALAQATQARAMRLVVYPGVLDQPAHRAIEHLRGRLADGAKPSLEQDSPRRGIKADVATLGTDWLSGAAHENTERAVPPMTWPVATARRPGPHTQHENVAGPVAQHVALVAGRPYSLRASCTT